MVSERVGELPVLAADVATNTAQGMKCFDVHGWRDGGAESTDNDDASQQDRGAVFLNWGTRARARVCSCSPCLDRTDAESH